MLIIMRRVKQGVQFCTFGSNQMDQINEGKSNEKTCFAEKHAYAVHINSTRIITLLYFTLLHTAVYELMTEFLKQSYN